ncbi:MAG: HD domain-containing protein [Bacteriovoracaceae bacterium]
MSYFGKFLYIENDGKVLDLVLQDKSLLDKFPSSFARTINEASNVLDKSGREIRLILMSEKMAKTVDTEGLKKKLESFPYLKIVLVPSPSSYMELVKHVQFELSAKHDWRNNQDDGTKMNQEISGGDDLYMQISMRDFVVTPKSYFNIYLRLSQGRYIKIIKAGDDLTSEQFEHYRAKGIDEFFVPKPEHEKFIHLQGTLSTEVVLSDASHGFKIKTVMKLGANVTANLVKCGISPDRMDNAHLFLDQTIHVLRNMKLNNEVVTSYLKNIDKGEHTSAVAFIAGILANHLGFESSKSIKVVGITALLHDIGLYDLDPNFIEGSELSDEKAKEIFQKHASHGAQILRATGAFEEVICDAVENHHRRRMGENARRRSTSMNLVTEIISVSDEFFNSVIHHGYSPEKVRFFMENELKTYSPNVEKAFQLLTKGKRAA